MIDHFADSLLKLPIKIGVHLINGELSQLLTLGGRAEEKLFHMKRNHRLILYTVAKTLQLK